jgi:hypothetical protein
MISFDLGGKDYDVERKTIPGHAGQYFSINWNKSLYERVLTVH